MVMVSVDASSVQVNALKLVDLVLGSTASWHYSTFITFFGSCY